MEPKELFLWVIESGCPVQKPLVKIVQESEKRYHVYKTLSDTKDWASLNLTYKPYQLIEAYFGASRKVENLFKEVAEKHHPDIGLHQKMEEAQIGFSGPEAFLHKCQEHNLSEDTIGYYVPKEGLVVSLQKNNTLEYTQGLIIHEFGHYLDHLLNQNRWNNSSREMGEMIAIFVQEKLNFWINYTEKHKIHHEAQRILRRLQQTNFSKRNFMQQWDYLRKMYTHDWIEFNINNLVGEEIKQK